MNALDGRKTYVVALCIVVVGVVLNQGLITQETANLAYTVLTGAGVASFRHAMSK